MLTKIVQRIVAACCLHAKLVLLISVLLGAASAYYSVTHFAINTDSSKLISTELPWRKTETALNTAFPQNNNLILVVIDGVTSERAQAAATSLVDTLKGQTQHFEFVQLPPEQSFYAKNGLLFKTTDEVQETTDQLVKVQPLLSTLSNDPSLRGFSNAMSLLGAGVERGDADLSQVAGPFGKFAAVFESALAGKVAPFSWQALFANKPGQDTTVTSENGRRRFIEIKPKLDFGNLEPGEVATDAIEKAITDLHLTPDTGVKVRLTGPVPLNDQEFGTVKDGFALNSIITVVAVLLILWAALKSGRLIFAVFASTAVGLLMTAALGLMLVGALNLISVAFAVLFIGIGVDFGIQFSVRYRNERFLEPDLIRSIVMAGGKAGRPLLLAAVATAAGFYSFLPTDYEGVSELGLIAGNGMIIAFLISITMLPALLTVLHPPSEHQEVGYTSLQPVDDFLKRHRAFVIGGTILIVLLGSPLLLKLRFDFNPLNLNSPKVESVATLLDLMKDPNTTTNTIQVLEPNLQDAITTGAKIAKLPEVNRVTTLESFVPEDQDAKLAIIQDAASVLGSTLDPPNRKPAPTDEQDQTALKTLADYAMRAAAKGTGPDAETAKRFSDDATKLSAADPAARQAARESLLPPLNILLAQIKDTMSAEKISLDTIPKDLARNWVTPEGQARVEVYPKNLSDANSNLEQFGAAVKSIAPDATGEPILIRESGHTVIWAFIEAGAWALASISILLVVVLRRVSDMLLTLVPLLLAGILTLEISVLINLPLNFANIIALPLLLGLGVAFKIYFVLAWRSGETSMLTSSLTRAVFFSALCTAVAFGSLWSSKHPGTASMGELLALSLACTLFMAVVFQTALMGPPRKKHVEPIDHDLATNLRKAA
ncbi:MMPL family transporter [Lichenihabitans psoromatis]|uniref:hopanoid transporter HpnN n=1 Tax=Lichenihabitans psoromatis TaxID=2528642 RepID=UPI0010358A06|nr:MMPL family transporter [Lichenihabitans psoromatis]